jgi:hypothetical protein
MAGEIRQLGRAEIEAREHVGCEGLGFERRDRRQFSVARGLGLILRGHLRIVQHLAACVAELSVVKCPELEGDAVQGLADVLAIGSDDCEAESSNADAIVERNFRDGGLMLAVQTVLE